MDHNRPIGRIRLYFNQSLSLDFSLAFDCLNHDQLLQNLRTLASITVKEVELFKIYLKYNKATCGKEVDKNNIIHKIHSETLNVRRSLPQVSVFGQL